MFVLAMLFSVGVACLVLLTTAALHWAPNHEASRNPFAFLAHWWADRIYDVRDSVQGYCWDCKQGFASAYDLQLHQDCSH